METGGGEPPKRLAKMKKRCFLSPADYNNMRSIISLLLGSILKVEKLNFYKSIGCLIAIFGVGIGVSNSSSNLIPTGKIKPVKNTPFDFSKLKSIGDKRAKFVRF